MVMFEQKLLNTFFKCLIKHEVFIWKHYCGLVHPPEPLFPLKLEMWLFFVIIIWISTVRFFVLHLFGFFIQSCKCIFHLNLRFLKLCYSFCLDRFGGLTLFTRVIFDVTTLFNTLTIGNCCFAMWWWVTFM